jgi:hypothetical protein
MPKIIDQISLISNIMSFIGKESPGIKINVRQYNAIVSAATDICDELRKDSVLIKNGMGIKAWLECDEVGASSLYVAHKLCDIAPKQNYAAPYDVSDFIRCEKLLIAAPELNDKFEQMAKCSDQWANLVSEWDGIRELIKDHRIQDANEVIRTCLKSSVERT